MLSRGVPVLFSLALVLAACGDSSDSDSESADDSGADESGEVSNACPVDGCQITIESVDSDGDELVVEWSTNFGPDVSRNHIHIYWDNFEAAQVSGDAVDNGFEQGEWVPTADFPTFTTQGAVSTAVRGDSSTICVTAADRDHNVMDTALVDCRDVSDLL